MAEGHCAKCSRYLLIVFNFLFWVSKMDIEVVFYLVVGGGEGVKFEVQK
jgi:hypothetical protein